MNKHKCPICNGTMLSGETDVVFSREKNIVVIEKIPALVCQDCNEASIESAGPFSLK